MLTAAGGVRAQPFKAARQLTSNKIVALAGGGDTLWAATERGFNYRTSPNAGNEWAGFEVGDLAYRFWGLGFGGGRAVAVLNKSGLNDSIGFWQFEHSGGSQRQRYFRFPPGVHGDSALPVGSVVYSNGSFWAPFDRGGLIRYNPSDNSVSAVRPGDGGELPPQNLGPLKDEDAGAKTVLSLDADPLDSAIIVTTPKALWRYHPYRQGDAKWEGVDANPTIVGASAEFVAFDAAFTVRKNGATALYAFMTVKRGGESDTVLYALDTVSKQWRVAINNVRRYSVFPAVNGCVYTLSENNVGVYADKQGDTLSVLTQPNEFRDMLRKAGDDPNPTVNDILFLPKTDSSGALAVATETGLYVCESAEPLSNTYGDFKLYRYIRDVGDGEAYALPGVIRGGGDGRYEKCVFVYNLKKDGDVTIKVYDYNMSLVKTVVRGGRRRADKSRSTDPSVDVWDGTNGSGKRVWPGVYYFKITTNAGERRFGKVILAK